ncbi:MAG TPA: hypothetical protein VN982_02515, partial [Candidatus Dormibacteraeota bacterium]|nr:hypothetical protein [Candidatus Dormibacteraeota bacterium]
MKTWVMVFVLLGAAHSVLAQEIVGVKEAKIATVADSVAPTVMPAATPVLVAAADLSNAAVWNHGVNLREIAASRAADAEPGFAAPAPQREGVTEDLSQLRWQIAIGPSFVRFRS